MSLPYVPWDGPTDARVLVVGERPGYDETRGTPPRPFIGKAGLELFGGFDDRGDYHAGHWRKWVGIPREAIRVGNVVPTFRHGENPEPWELAKWGPECREEIRRVGPDLIVTFGAHAARYLLQTDLPMDLLNACPHAYEGGTIVPVVHPAYALREPTRQDDLAEGLRTVRRVLDGQLSPRSPLKKLDPERVTLAQFATLARGQAIDADREGDVRTPECFTFACGAYAALWYCDDRRARPIVQAILDAASSVNFHYAVADLKAAWSAGLTVPRVDDSMILAFLLNDHQGLKDLAYTRLGVQIPSFEDLQGPVDVDRVYKAVLRWAVELRDDPRMHETVSVKRISEKTGKLLKPEVRPTNEAKALKKTLSSVMRLVEEPTDMRKRWTTSVVLGPARVPPPVVTWQDLPKETREPYALRDPYVTGLVRRQMQQEIRREGLGRLHRIDRNVVPLLARMEHVGMAVNPWALKKLTKELDRAFNRVCVSIAQMVGRPVNPNASEDVSELLFGDLGVTPTKRTKGKGYYTTEDKYLEARKSEHPVIPLIIRGRQFTKMRGVCEGIVAAAMWVEADDCFVLYPNLTYTRVISGRLSAKDPNILAVPKHSKWGRLIRAAFFARPGRVLLSHDLSQIELRTAAHVSRDPALVHAFTTGEDLHAKTAYEVLGAPRRREDQDESLHRLPAKTTNFSILMGTTAYGLADTINEALADAFERTQGRVGEPGRDFKSWTPDDTGRLLTDWYRVYPGVKAFNQRTLQCARRTGYVEDCWGRRRWSGGLHSSNRWIREAAEREVQSFPYQAGAKGLMKVWQARIWSEIIVPWQSRGRYVEPWLDVHDDQIVEVNARFEPAVSKEMTACLPQLFCVPVQDDAKRGACWGELE